MECQLVGHLLRRNATPEAEDNGKEDLGKLADKPWRGDFGFKGWLNAGTCAKSQEAWEREHKALYMIFRPCGKMNTMMMRK